MPFLGLGVKKVQASSNRIGSIRKKNFQLCKNLQYLNLTKNHIEKIQEDSFSNAQNMISIQLKENRLV